MQDCDEQAGVVLVTCRLLLSGHMLAFLPVGPETPSKWFNPSEPLDSHTKVMIALTSPLQTCFA